MISVKDLLRDGIDDHVSGSMGVMPYYQLFSRTSIRVVGQDQDMVREQLSLENDWTVLNSLYGLTEVTGSS